MNGPQHYTAAELALARADRAGDDAARMAYCAEAQVHATLALAAANAASVEGAFDDGPPLAVHADPGWSGVLGYATLPFDGEVAT